jgi:hypothetical protein
MGVSRSWGFSSSMGASHHLRCEPRGRRAVVSGAPLKRRAPRAGVHTAHDGAMRTEVAMRMRAGILAMQIATDPESPGQSS